MACINMNNCNKWTIKTLTETDDITFAMCILSERQSKLNPNSPIAQKFASAFNALDRIRGSCPIADSGCLKAVRRSIFKEVEREYAPDDMRTRLNAECDTDSKSSYDLHGLTAAKIIADIIESKGVLLCIQTEKS